MLNGILFKVVLDRGLMMRMERGSDKPTTQRRRRTIRLDQQSKTEAPWTKDTRALRDLSDVLHVSRAIPESWRSSTCWAAPLIRRTSFRRARSGSLQSQVVPEHGASRNTEAVKCVMKRNLRRNVSTMSQAPMTKFFRLCTTITRGCSRGI